MKSWIAGVASFLVASAWAGAADEPLRELDFLKGDASITGVFSWALALEGGTAAIGAYFEFADDHRGGVVYVFGRQGASWRQQARLGNLHAEPGDQFGESLAISGDRLVVGAPDEDGGIPGVDGDQEDNSEIQSGAAFVFSRDASGSWHQEAYLKASNPDGTTNQFGVGGDNFGDTVAISGDTIAVSAPTEDSAATGVDGDQSDNSTPSAGAVYVFARVDGSWEQQAYLKSPSGDASDFFGTAMALDGDRLAVGATGEDSGSLDPQDNSVSGSGAVFVFERNGSTWEFRQFIKAPDRDEDDRFGGAIALSGDTMVIGAPDEDSSSRGINGDLTNNLGHDSGAAFVYRHIGGEWVFETYLKSHNSNAEDHFGDAIALHRNSLIIGASQFRVSLGDTSGPPGAAYRFVRDQNDSEWYQEEILLSSNGRPGDLFGSSVALWDDTVLVGAPFESSGAPSSGAAYIFGRPADSIGEITSASMERGGLRITMPIAIGRDVGIEYSPDLSPGSWMELGNFFELGDEATFIDPDFVRLGRGSGFYRAFLRPVR